MRSICFVLVLCALGAAPASADLLGTVNLSETGYHLWTGMTVHYSGAVADGVTVVTGVYEVTLSGYSGPLPAGAAGMLTGEVDAFCIDIWDWATSSPTRYDVRTLNDAPNGVGGCRPNRRQRWGDAEAV